MADWSDDLQELVKETTNAANLSIDSDAWFDTGRNKMKQQAKEKEIRGAFENFMTTTGFLAPVVKPKPLPTPAP